MKEGNRVSLSWFGQFLLACSGVRTVLFRNKRELDAERPKYMVLGAVVLFTALFAFIACLFALDMIFGFNWYTIATSIAYAGLIFTIDFYLVATTTKPAGFNMKNIASYVPRFIMAVVLGFTLSTPLILKVFEKEINQELVIMKAKEGQRIEESIRTQFGTRIEDLEKEIAGFEREITECRAIMYKRRQDFDAEMAGKNSGTGRYGYGPVARSLEREYERQSAICKELERKLTPKIDASRDQKAGLLRQISEKTNESTLGVTSQYDGLAARLTALSRLERKNGIVNVAVSVLHLLFIIIEISPVLSKLLSPRGVYDEYLEQNLVKAKSQYLKEVSELNAELNEIIETKVGIAAANTEREVKDHSKLLDKISGQQFEIVDDLLSQWKEEQIKKIRESPNDYLK